MSDYCPECGDNKYIEGCVCLECGFPTHYIFPEQVYPDLDLYDDYETNHIEELIGDTK